MKEVKDIVIVVVVSVTNERRCNTKCASASFVLLSAFTDAPHYDRRRYGHPDEYIRL